jgi:hypothetical protein
MEANLIGYAVCDHSMPSQKQMETVPERWECLGVKRIYQQESPGDSGGWEEAP